MHSLAQEMTMLTDYTSIEAAEERIDELRDMLETGADPVALLEAEGIRPCIQWINELRDEDVNVFIELE